MVICKELGKKEHLPYYRNPKTPKVVNHKFRNVFHVGKCTINQDTMYTIQRDSMYSDKR